MAIFAKKHDSKKIGPRPETEPTAVATPRASSQEPAAAAATAAEINSVAVKAAPQEAGLPGTGATAAAQGDRGGAVPVQEVGGASVAASEPGADEKTPAPARLEPADIEPMDIDPEVIETSGEGSAAAFGIVDAIRLMRSLPSDPNIDLVVRVVRVTLGAVNVSIEEIMQDSSRKEKTLEENIASLQTQADQLERQLYAKRCEIAAQEADLREMITVRERLHMADKYTGHRPPPTPVDATRNPHPKPHEWAAEWERSENLKGDHLKG